MKEHFHAIKDKYDGFYRKMMKDGMLPMRSTDTGFWHASINHEVFEAFQKIGIHKGKRFLDLGSGDGSVVLIASLFGPKCVGVESDEWLVMVSKRIQGELKHLPKVPTASFINQDFMSYPVHGFDFIYLCPDTPLYRGLETKLLDEMKGKLILYGNNFFPQHLKEEQSFDVNGTRVGVYKK